MIDEYERRINRHFARQIASDKEYAKAMGVSWWQRLLLKMLVLFLGKEENSYNPHAKRNNYENGCGNG